MLQIDEKTCSGVVQKTINGVKCHGCKYGHAILISCYGNGYPTGVPIPVCVNENKAFDEERGVVTRVNWTGEA